MFGNSGEFGFSVSFVDRASMLVESVFDYIGETKRRLKDRFNDLSGFSKFSAPNIAFLAF